MNVLRSKIRDGKAVIGIIGLGYVGLPLAIRFVKEGFETIGFDIDDQKIKSLLNSKSYINHIGNQEVEFLIKNKFKPTSDFSFISSLDVIIICVPTPLGIHKDPDLSYIKNTIELIKPYLKQSQLLVLESTTYPGTTEEEILPEIENIGFKIGEDYFIGYSPEREDPGNENFTTKNIPKVVSGLTKNCKLVVEELYSAIIDEIVPVSSIKTAEMTKILENIHRAVNIGLVNELKMVTEKMGIDIYEVIKAAGTKPFGFTSFYPGPGLGGHCIPIDPFYLTWKAKEFGMNTRFVELAGEINTNMPDYVIQKIGEALNQKNKSIKNSKILVLGLSYKKNVDDVRESPSLKMIDILLKLGAKVKFNDPYFDSVPITRKYNFNLQSIEITEKTLKSFDIVLLSTDHDNYNYKLIEKFSNLIVDTRGRFNNIKKVFRA